MCIIELANSNTLFYRIIRGSGEGFGISGWTVNHGLNDQIYQSTMIYDFLRQYILSNYMET